MSEIIECVDSPRYAHDCDSCRFLGRFDGDARWANGSIGTYPYDLYFCGQGAGVPTLLCRYGDDGPEYQSGLIFGFIYSDVADHPAGEAYRRAREEGLIVDDEHERLVRHYDYDRLRAAGGLL